MRSAKPNLQGITNKTPGVWEYLEYRFALSQRSLIFTPSLFTPLDFTQSGEETVSKVSLFNLSELLFFSRHYTIWILIANTPFFKATESGRFLSCLKTIVILYMVPPKISSFMYLEQFRAILKLTLSAKLEQNGT